MASLSLRHIYKVYDGKVKAVNDFSMEIQDKEFIVFVGPSGCGKSTTLRMIAGLEEITAGDLYIGDVLVNNMEPKDRDIAMVFQNYALYPHMTVFENMAFALRIKKMSKEAIEKKVHEAAAILDIEEYLDRFPKALSGGQRQRVALGRAIVREPKVFLLDEPLSNLDAKLRTQMRTEITKLHKKLQTTFIYVTHDQVEAMTMGSRIVVMKDGFIQQIDSPQNLYSYPGNKFVAGFIGSPQMNFYDAYLSVEGMDVVISFANTNIKIPAEKLINVDPEYFDGRKVIFGIRPQALSNDPITLKNNPNSTIECLAQLVEELGSETNVFGDLDITEKNAGNVIDTSTNITAKSEPDIKVNVGDKVKFAVDINNIHLFDAETELTIKPRIPEFNKPTVSINGDKMEVFGETMQLPLAITEQLKTNGSYRCIIPSRGIRIVEKGIEAKVYKDEIIGEDRLLTLLIHNHAVFAIICKDMQLDENVNVEFDMKALTIVDKTPIVKALPLINNLKGYLIKQKINGKMAYAYKIGENLIDVPLNIVNKLVSSAGKKVFGIELNFDFSVYAAIEGNVEAKYIKTVDYGKEQFDEYIVSGQQIFLKSLGKPLSKFGVDIKDINVTDVKLDIKLL